MKFNEESLRLLLDLNERLKVLKKAFPGSKVYEVEVKANTSLEGIHGEHGLVECSKGPASSSARDGMAFRESRL